jgi:cellulose synthase/poly-beta-1,6-N-acetylglucosamine synthase-like glycosyltransferase
MSWLAISCGILTVTCTFLFIYPYVLYPATLTLVKKRPIKVGVGHTDGDGFALFFCAYNEALVIEEKLANIRDLRARYPRLKVFAYDDASDDGTLEALEAVHDVVQVTRGLGRTGKAHGMKTMVAAATESRYLVFTDANVIVDPDAIDEFYRYYNDPEVGGICGSLHYLTSVEATATEATGGMYWRIEEWIKGLESDTGNVMGADGSLFSVRKDIYPEFPDTVQDDFTVSMAAVFAGQRLVKAPAAIAYEKLVAARADEGERKIRVAARAYHTHKVMLPGRKRLRPLDKYKYAAHKTLRWWGAIPLLAGTVAAVVFVASLGLPGVIALAALLLMAVGVAFGVPKIGAFVADLVLAVVAALRGVLQAIRGRTVAIWTPPSSR